VKTKRGQAGVFTAIEAVLEQNDEEASRQRAASSEKAANP
jgi:hypothetical protein